MQTTIYFPQEYFSHLPTTQTKSSLHPRDKLTSLCSTSVILGDLNIHVDTPPAPLQLSYYNYWIFPTHMHRQQSLSQCGENKGDCCRLQENLHPTPHPLTIGGAAVEQVSSTKFLGVHIIGDLSWSNNTTSITKKAQQHLYFVSKLKRAGASGTPSTEAPSRASSAAASRCGSEAAQHPTARPCSAS